MTSNALATLKIEYLRGSVTPFALTFGKNKRLTIVYGKNGSGKTTICDAFEFLAKGRVGSLEDRGLGSRTEKYWPSLGRTAAAIVVTLEAADGNCTARVRNGSVVASPDSQRPHVEVLRRNQILRLLEAQPAKRYAEIKRFIDITGVEASEETLRKLIEDLNSNRNTAVAVVEANQKTIEQFWEAAGKPGDAPFTWAETEAKKDTSALKEIVGALGELRAAYDRIAGTAQRKRDGESALHVLKAAQAAAAERLANALAGSVTGDEELLEILEGAQRYLHEHPRPGVCPLCESAERVASLRENVDRRLQQFESLRSARLEKSQKDHEVVQAESSLKSIDSEMTRTGDMFQRIVDARPWGPEVTLPKHPFPKDAAEFAAWVADTAELPSAWIVLEGSRQEHRKFVDALVKALETYNNNVAEQRELDLLLPRLRRTHEILLGERQKYTDGVLIRIAAEVGRMYEAVHPGEGLEKISLQLEAGKRASLEIGASFAGETKTPPQAYFSQSHLDTLGLCVFLALSGMENPDQTILVLDDVLASVDEPHVERIVEMLHAEALKFRHCIITTHYRPWKQKLQWGWLRNGQCHFVELLQWTLLNGMQHVGSVPEMERLRPLLAAVPPDPQLICAKAGVILEAALNFLTELYECKLPRRRGSLYTLGDLLSAIDKKLRQALTVDVHAGIDDQGKILYRTVALAPMIDELTRIAQARNVFGAHFSELSFDLLEDDGVAFGFEVLKLIDSVVDPDNGWPRKERQGSYWANANETRRLHPLKRPE